MGRFRYFALVGAVVVSQVPLGVLAADMPMIPPQPPIEIGHDWYLKGYIGMANQHFDGLSHPAIDDAIANDSLFEWLDTGNFDAVPLFGIGVGYQHSNNLRFDITGEYRGKSAFSALDHYEVDTSGDPGTFGTNEYTGKKSEWLFLVNGYYDIGTWHNVTPYVGAGIGVSLNTIDDFRDVNTPNANTAFAPSATTANLAWALHAGVGIQATENLTIDLGYSFVSLGKAQTGTLITPGGTPECVFCAPMTFNNLYSHDFKFGIRYAFGAPAYTGPAVVKY
jgi:opacity protein-like surface antigen